MAIVSVHNLTKSYRKGQVKALRGVDFEVEEGEIYGIIGPDGAGKTTLFRILATLLLADEGRATMDGLDVVRDYKSIRQRIGYMPGRFSLYQDLTVEENLRFFASIFNTTVEENYHLVKDIYQQIEPFKERRAGKLSGGMKQKLALSCALIHSPRILLLDEPTTGVDPVSRKEFWEMLKRLKEHGISILVSTPYMDEAMQCDRIALIQEGQFMQVDSPRRIIESYHERLLSVSSRQMHPLLADLRRREEVLTAFSFGETYHITVTPEAKPESLIEALKGAGHTELKIEEIEPGIEDCFMALMKREG